MDRQSARTSLQRDAAKLRNIWPRQVAAVTKHGDGIEIDGEFGWHGPTVRFQDRKPCFLHYSASRKRFAKNN
jgi:hypothetical protein